MTIEVFLLGASPDAMPAVTSVLAALSREVPMPLVVLLPHRDVGDDLCSQLQLDCPLPVEEPDDKDEILPGRVYLAPAGYHLLLDRGSFVLSREPPIDQQRPSFMPLFETAADSYADAAAGLILTGVAGRHCESPAPLQARGGAVAVGWVPAAGEAPPVVCVPVLERDAVNPWVLEMCTSHTLRGRP